MEEDVPDTTHTDLSKWKRNKDGAYEVPPGECPPRMDLKNWNDREYFENKEIAKKQVLRQECTWMEAEKWLRLRYGERGRWTPWEKRELGAPLSQEDEERIRIQEGLEEWSEKREREEKEKERKKMDARKDPGGGGRYHGMRRLTEGPLPSRDPAPPERDETFDPRKRWRAVIENASLEGNLTVQPIFMPVVRRGNAPDWVSFDWNMINKIQKNIMEYGTDNRLVRQQIGTLLTHTDLVPYDIKLLMETLLTPTQNMLFLQKWEQRLEMKMAENMLLPAADPLSTATLDMLMGKGNFADPQRQARLVPRIREQSQRCALWVFEQLPQMGTVSPSYTKIVQGEQESFMLFVDRLKEAVDKAPNIQGEMRATMVKELAMQNANPTCKQLLARLPMGATLVEMIEACARERLAWEEQKAQIHSVALAAALKQVVPARQNNQNKGPVCYECLQPGHLRRDCPNRVTQNNQGVQRASAPQGEARFQGTCFRCAKFGHRAVDCRVKFHKNGSPLPGNQQSRGGSADNKYSSNQMSANRMYPAISNQAPANQYSVAAPPAPAQFSHQSQIYPPAAAAIPAPPQAGSPAWRWQQPAQFP